MAEDKQDEAVAAAEAPAPKTKRYRVNTGSRAQLNGRAGPGESHRVRSKASPDEVLTVVEVRDGWAKAKDGHWFKLAYLEEVQ